jgi:hypothetical protein
MSFLDDHSEPQDSWAGQGDSPAEPPNPAGEEPAATEAALPVAQETLQVPPIDVTRLPSRFQADLMQAIFSATRDECVSLVEQARADGAAAVDTLRRQAEDEAAALQQRADEDQAETQEWLRLETERLNAEYERRVGERRDALAVEVEAHAADVERRVETTQGRVTTYEEQMKEYVARLADAPDPAGLVAVAQQIPEPPTRDDLLESAAPASAVAGAVVIPGEPDVETSVPTWTVLDAFLGPQVQPGDNEALFLGPDELGTHGEPVVRTGELEHGSLAVGEVEPHQLSEASMGEWSAVIDAMLGPQARPEDARDFFGPIVAGAAASSAAGEGAEGTAERAREADEMDPATGVSWPSPDRRAADEQWAAAGADTEAPAVPAEAETAEAETAEPETAEPEVDAAAQKAVAAVEATDDELTARIGADPWAGATWSDEMVAPAVDAAVAAEVVTAEVVAAEEEGAPQVAPRSGASALSDVEPTVTTRVSVSGLASVAGVTSFRRSLARLDGVQGVAVNALSDGSFEFDVTHHPNVRLGDEVPALPGFDAQVMAAEADALNVYASDPLRYP